MVSVLKAATSKPRKASYKLERAALAAARHALLNELQDLEHRAHGLGLHVTAHALNKAKNALGWEMAGDVEKAGEAARGEMDRA